MTRILRRREYSFQCELAARWYLRPRFSGWGGEDFGFTLVWMHLVLYFWSLPAGTIVTETHGMVAAIRPVEKPCGKEPSA